MGIFGDTNKFLSGNTVTEIYIVAIFDDLSSFWLFLEQTFAINGFNENWILIFFILFKNYKLDKYLIQKSVLFEKVEQNKNYIWQNDCFSYKIISNKDLNF